MDENDDGDERVEDNSVKITEFRSRMVTCLKVYVNTFYSQEFSGESATKLLLVSNYDPVDVAKALSAKLLAKVSCHQKNVHHLKMHLSKVRGRESDTYHRRFVPLCLKGKIPFSVISKLILWVKERQKPILRSSEI